MRTEAAGLSPFPVRGAGAGLGAGPGAGPGSARLSSGGSCTARTPVSASARGGARPALGDALPSAPARCVTAQGTVLPPPRLSLLFSFPFSLEGARRRGGSARACPGGSAVSGAPVAQAGRCHSPRGKRRGDLIARHGLFPLRSPSPLRCWSTPGSSDVIWAEPAGMVPARVWAPRAPSLGSARLAFGIPLPAAAPRGAQWGWDSQRVVPRLFLALEGISFGEGLVGRLLARSELCSGLAVTGAGYLLNQSVFKWIT